MSDSDAVLSVRFTAAELARLKAEAGEEGTPVSAYVRRHALTRPAAPFYVTGTPLNRSASGATTSGITIDAFAGGYITGSAAVAHR